MTINKNMLKALDDWWHGRVGKNHSMVYVQDPDRVTTASTVRRLMYEIKKKDIHGEEFISVFSGATFRRHMREYFKDVAERYMRHPGEDDPVKDYIASVPHTAGWITLIIEDVEGYSDRIEERDEFLELLSDFAAKYANVLLIGSGSFTDVFADCENVECLANGDEEENCLALNLYSEDGELELERETYEDDRDERKALTYYWSVANRQLKDGFLDYGHFKRLFRDTWEYLVPHVSEDQVVRQDIELIEHIGKFRRPNIQKVDGCEPWEMDAAAQFAAGLHDAVINDDGYNDRFSDGELAFYAEIDDPPTEYGGISESGCLFTMLQATPKDLDSKADLLAKTIRTGYYEGDSFAAFQMTNHFGFDDDVSEKELEEQKAIQEVLGSLKDGIRKIADETINKEPERRVRRNKDTGEI